MLDKHEFFLTLVRHGQSITNANPDLMGQHGNTPLSEKGIDQAKLLQDRLYKQGELIDIVYSSHYTRAHDTAKIALEKIVHPEIKIAEDLREYCAGDWTDASRKETMTLSVQNRMSAMSHCFLPPNGESLHQVERRAGRWLEENILYNEELIKQSSALNTPLNIYCFTHGMTIKCLLHYVMGFDMSFTWKVGIENTSLSKLFFGKDGWRLLSINDCAHLL